MKNFICKKCGNTTYIMQEKLNGTGKAIGLYCAKCGTWHKWLNKQEKVLYATHSAEIDKDKEIARLTAELEKYKRALRGACKVNTIFAEPDVPNILAERVLYEFYIRQAEEEIAEGMEDE